MAQAPANFTLSHSDNLTSTQHNRTQSDGSELNLRPPPSQDFPSSFDHSIAEGTGVGIRESVLPGEGGSLSAHLSGSTGLNSNQSTGRNLGSIGLPPPPIGDSLSVSSHGSSTNLLSSINNPLSSFLPNPSSLSSLTSIGGGGGNVLPSGLRLQDGTSSMSQHPHPPQLQPLPPHLSSLSFMNSFAQLQSSSLGMGGNQHQQQQHSRAQTQSHNIIGQNLPAITSAPSSQHLQQPQHNIQAPNLKSRPQQSTNTHNIIKPTIRGDATDAPLSQHGGGNGRPLWVTAQSLGSTPSPWNAQYVPLSLYRGTSFSSCCCAEPSLSAHH